MTEQVKDPVCGMTLDRAKAAGSVQFQGKTYYFCAPTCQAKFEKAPQQYVRAASHKHQHSSNH